MRRERRKKKFLTPRLCSIWSTVWEQKKKTPQHKSTYTIKHMTLQHGEHIQLWQAAIRSSAIVAPVSDLLALVAVQSIFRGSWMGEGSNVCNGGKGARESSLHRSLRVVKPDGLGQGAGTGSQKDKIKLLWLLGRTAAKFPQLILFVHSDLWNHQISLPKQRVSSWWYPYSGL